MKRRKFPVVAEIAVLVAVYYAAAKLGLTLALNHSEAWTSFGKLWLTWWSGDGVGALVVTPLILTWIEKSKEQFGARRLLEAAALALSLTAVELWIFTTLFYSQPSRYPL